MSAQRCLSATMGIIIIVVRWRRSKTVAKQNHMITTTAATTVVSKVARHKRFVYDDWCNIINYNIWIIIFRTTRILL